MDEEVKIDVGLITTCHGCLSNDRKITPLGENSDTLVSLLGSYRDCLVYGIEDIKLCWECMTMLRKFKSFKNQVRKAQAGLMKMLYEIDSQTGTLSKLTIVNKYYFDQDIKHYSHTKLKKNNEQLEDITIIKTEFEDIRSYSDDDEDITLNELETKCDALDNKRDRFDNKRESVDNKRDRVDNKRDRVDNKRNRVDNKKDALDNKVEFDTKTNDDDNKHETISDTKDLQIETKDEVLSFTYDIKDELDKSETVLKVKQPRRKQDTKCVNNCVGYYKKYAKLVKTEEKDWGSWDTVRSHFESVQFGEKEMEEHFYVKDRRNTSYHRLPHKCLVCTLGYTKKDDLKRHNDLNHHKEGTPYKCSLCNKRQASNEALEKHWRTHSIVFRCKTCSNVCKEIFMRKHLDHAHTKTYACSICHMKFGTLKWFTVHYKEMHMNYVCDYCNHTLTSKKKMEKHISEHHMTYTCKDCNRQYKNYIYYKKHCYSLHPDKVKSKQINPELSFCVECNKQFPSVDKYKTHLRVSTKHNKKKHVPLPCPECGKVFGRKKNMMYHYNLFHMKKTKYYCDICDKYFARPSGLTTHRENVHLKIEKVKDKICDLCGRGFSNNVVLRHHRRTHTGERPHKCPHCAAEFIQKYAMQTHVRTQHKEFVKDVPFMKDAPAPAKRTNIVPPWPEAGYFV